MRTARRRGRHEMELAELGKRAIDLTSLDFVDVLDVLADAMQERGLLREDSRSALLAKLPRDLVPEVGEDFSTEDLVRVTAYAWARATYANILHVSMHTADPLDGGPPRFEATSEATYARYARVDYARRAPQWRHEVSYPGYARVPVPRSPEGWSIDDGSAANVRAITFPVCTGPCGEVVVTHCAVGRADLIIAARPLASRLDVSIGVTPTFREGAIRLVVS